MDKLNQIGFIIRAGFEFLWELGFSIMDSNEGKLLYAERKGFFLKRWEFFDDEDSEVPIFTARFKKIFFPTIIHVRDQAEGLIGEISIIYRFPQSEYEIKDSSGNIIASAKRPIFSMRDRVDIYRGEAIIGSWHKQLLRRECILSVDGDPYFAVDRRLLLAWVLIEWEPGSGA